VIKLPNTYKLGSKWESNAYVKSSYMEIDRKDILETVSAKCSTFSENFTGHLKS